MNEEQKHLSLKDRLLKDIRSGEVSMTPKVYFTLKLSALIVIACSVLVISIFIINFIFFSIRINSQDVLLGFGPRGLNAFARFFPWHLLILDIGLIIVLQWLLRKFRSAYKVPMVYVLGALLLGAFVLGFALDKTSFNDQLMARSGRLPPPFGEFYGHAEHPHSSGSGVCRCTIVAIDGNKVIVQDPRDASTTITVILPSNDPRATTTSLHVGDTVFVAGDEDNGTIQAFGLHKELPGEHRYRGPMPRH